VLSYRRRLLAVLVPRVIAQWPAIGAIALAVVLAHSGVAHVDASAEVAEYYRHALGEGWTRTVGIVQLLAAGGLCFQRTRVMTASAFAALVLIGITNQVRTDRPVLTGVVLLGWACVVAWGEARRARWS
jgi:hypothetical protein